MCQVKRRSFLGLSGELSRYDSQSAGFVPFLSGISADSVTYSRDGQWVAYASYPEGTLWTSKLDGSQRLQLSYPPFWAEEPCWSPDGKQIAFNAFSNGQKAKLYTVSSDGGTPRELLPEDSQGDQFDPCWAPDGARIVFGSGYRIPTPRSESSTSGLIKFPRCRDPKAFSRPSGRPTDALLPPCPSIPAALCFSISPPKGGKKSQRHDLTVCAQPLTFDAANRPFKRAWRFDRERVIQEGKGARKTERGNSLFAQSLGCVGTRRYQAVPSTLLILIHARSGEQSCTVLLL